MAIPPAKTPTTAVKLDSNVDNNAKTIDTTMKKNPHFLLLASALLLCLSCTFGDETLPAVAPSGPTEIPYEVTAGDGGLTRTTLNGSTQMIFESGDQLEITGTDISGTLSLASTSNEGRTARFSGSLTWSGTGTPADDLALSATLKGNGASSPFTQTGIGATFADAFQKYSLFRTETTGTYAERSFQLRQQSTFVVFTITFSDGTTAGTTFNVTVGDDGDSSIATGTTTTATDGSAVKATFTLALEGGRTLAHGKAVLTAGSAVHEFSFGGDSKTYEKNKYYKADRTVFPFEVVVQSDISEWTPGIGGGGDVEI